MRKLFGYILSPVHYLAFGLILVIFHPVQWICFNAFGYRAHKWVIDVMNSLLTASYYLLGNTVKFTNHQNLPVGRPIIFIANHQSLYDIPVLIWFLRKYHAKFISKIELTKGIPSVSYNLRHGGAANIDRKDPRQSIMEIGKLGTRMKENKWGAVIFPEGTRSKDGMVKTFQAAGVATLLKKCPEALLVPIAIDNSWKMVRYGQFPLNTFIAMSWEVLTPVEPAGKPVDESVSACETAIKQALGQ
ncbi:lysophospholipid acyltransferase family protein [Mucilaginibacter ginsenosidivorans]|uniref:1-acyl-sn-glycerol-3-phosphate acyltransferase n=1 Tax=Mucilaginibacter ginsenosidivorans TaxID=398053 RepID=A0A5B8UQV6_9SPHI|nr:lysophospholipid acyltransferase family protein [Mucilaginibacter ginsenosidivorans]QEC61198.1 1-acyl-sn-glycerol-3-phosphate acyltransferase [Mucilaginibacter ginsenosidivorans]